MSRTIKFAKAGGPEVLEFIETQVPTPGPREVRIKVKAIGINRAESMWRNDKYIEPVKFPAGLGYDAAGVVDDVGKDVTDFAVGDAVSTIPAFSMNKYFTYGHSRPRACRRETPGIAFIRRSSVSLDDVHNGLRRAHIRRSSESGRLRHYSRSFEQRRLGGDPNC
jgi:D-arabinose 1-dehydrogenase-like Zn-dependent alcohol dehydrogenase